MTQELKPCPFCGADGACHGDGYVGEYYGIVNCADCGGAMQVMPGTEAEAITAWNTRHAPDMAAVVEALQKADKALCNHACHGEDAPCRRSKIECQTECGFEAGNALISVRAALQSLNSCQRVTLRGQP